MVTLPTLTQEHETKVTFSPLYSRILVKRDEPKGTTMGGIIIPDAAKDKPKEGIVLEAGSGRINEQGQVIPLAVKKGDRVLLSGYSETEIRIDGEDLLIIQEDAILGILD